MPCSSLLLIFEYVFSDGFSLTKYPVYVSPEKFFLTFDVYVCVCVFVDFVFNVQ